MLNLCQGFKVAVIFMVIDHANGLHKGITGGWHYKFKPYYL